ncbi:MAG: DEAD/DEAH box helicase family protein [Polyangiaceae bacterium]|nr:DEAD/DEAH box helicase family protein [Polyangiaceae bacterium]
MTTFFQSKYWATQLSLKGPSGSLGQLSRSISNARVDLNPHQVDAALFAVRSPLSKGVVLADEVGLGKTIEAGLVLAQRWAERRRRILIIVPATLRKQWAQELDDKFHIPTIVLESASFNRMVKAGKTNPFDQEDRVVVCSYHFAANKSDIVAMHPWDLVVIDEAHRLRNVYKKSNKMARTLRDTLQASSKVLLTATPLQNTLMELYGLVSFIDPHIFGDEPSYRDQFVRVDDEGLRNEDLRRRLAPVCHRTLRRQVLEYIKFTQRIPITWEFFPTDDEQQLYEEVSAYLQREALFALPRAQRKLMTMVLRKLLASSSFAIAGTLRSLINRLEKQVQEMRDAEDVDELVADYESYDETRDEWDDNGADLDGDTSSSSAAERELLQAEIDALKGYLALAERISHNAKGNALLDALSTAFGKAAELGGAQKAVVFTESQRTQAYLFELLERLGYEGKVVILNGTNADQRSKDIYKAWLARHGGQEVVSGSRPVDVKAAIVEEFRERATILVATEAAAEGVNLQFCSLVVNYDLPWNPQRIEQRIGRCHRYGQRHDVVVVNFLNKKNAADERVYELLAQKFHLFDGVFGSSDEVLGALESGVDIERRIAEIYQDCRTQEDIAWAFAKLQADLDEQIQDRLAQTRQVVLDYFDEEVHDRLRVHRDEARAALDERGRRLLALARSELGAEATFEDGAARFHYQPSGEPLAPSGSYSFDWKEAEERGGHFFRTDHALAQALIQRSLARQVNDGEVVFDYQAYGAPVAILAERLGQSGWLRATKVNVKSIEAEEHLLVAAIADTGLPAGVRVEALDAEWCDRLLNVPAKAAGATSVSGEVNGQLDELIAQQHAAKLEEIETRNGKYFEEEVDKLDRWAEDVKLTLERELKELDAEIRAARKDSKTKVVLADKLEAQRRIKTLEQRRNSKRRQLFDAQDDVDKKRTQLIEDIERQLRTSAQRETLFTIRWVLSTAPSN